MVGPNGSGKSNVVDALAWVMGEQGAKTLRGGKMEDVIFAGAGERKPLGRAEVTLTIDNADGALPIEFSEVSVTRRMFRDGASEYEINGAKARLMDIQELLSDSGIGREMHVIVGQGRLAQILESRPEERRAFIEEAAGVLKHRRRKEKAQRKLVGMQANLDRLTDLTTELSRQLKPLARQAEAARRAQTVQADLRDARLKLAADELVRLSASFESATSQAEMLAQQVAQVTESLEEATGKQNELDAALARITPEAEAAQQLWFELSALAERVSATIRIASDRAKNQAVELSYQGQDPEELLRRAQEADQQQQELDEQVEVARARLEAVREEVEEREAQAREADREHLAAVRAVADRREGAVRLLAAEESLRSQLAAAQSEVEQLSEQAQEAAQALARVRDEAEENAQTHKERQAQREPLAGASERADQEARAADERFEQLRGKERELERTISRVESRIETLRSAAPVSDAAGLLPDFAQLIDFVQVQTGVERAVSAALGELDSALVGPGLPEALDTLAGESISRTTLLSADFTAQPWRLEATLPADCSWLLDHLTIAPAASALYRLLIDVALAPDIASAQELVAADPRLRAVTRDGVVVGDGWISVGAGAKSPVEVASDIAASHEQLESLHSELEQLSGTLEGARQAAQELRVEAATVKAALRDHEELTRTLDAQTSRLERELRYAQQAQEKNTVRLAAAEQRAAEVAEKLEDTLDRVARVSAPEHEEEPSTAQRDATAAALSQVKAMEVEARLALRTAEERAGQSRGRGDSLRRQADYERQARAQHERAMAKRREQAQLARVVELGARDVAQRTQEATQQAAAQRDTVNAQKQQLTGALAQAKDAVHAAQMQLNRLTDSAHASDIARSQAQVRIEEATERVIQQLGMPAEELLADYAPGEDFDREAERARLKQAEKDLAALGKVNPLALEEFKALEERYEFLANQLSDVEQARRDLQGVIEEVDAKILQLFTEAWQDVEAEFPEVFSTLFPGGQGRLVLTEPEDMLATGIEVEARPPGKKVKRLSLLSGGEKSLTALAMLVAIFKARPSPFYVMDEVEAALDDTNLRRLIALFEKLRESSQLIVITHQKPTMDVANVLYGVTMRGDGITRVISQRMSPAGASPTAAP